jgi:uncharacterized protein (UPF0333 family)
MNRNTQRGEISSGLIVGLVGLVALILISIVVIGQYIHYANYGNRTENGLNARVENNENIYAQGTQKIVEIAQVPTMYVEDLSKVTKEAIGGRYGADGSKAVFQMLKEQNPQLDPSMYKKIQQVIEEFRNEFQENQTQLVDEKRSYQNALGNVWSGLWLGFAGYPKTPLSKWAIVSTDKAADTFKTHRDKGVQLRPAPAASN